MRMAVLRTELSQFDCFEHSTTLLPGGSRHSHTTSYDTSVIKHALFEDIIMILDIFSFDKLTRHLPEQERTKQTNANTYWNTYYKTAM